jgi:hypothetical protein
MAKSNFSSMARKAKSYPFEHTSSTSFENVVVVVVVDVRAFSERAFVSFASALLAMTASNASTELPLSDEVTRRRAEASSATSLESESEDDDEDDDDEARNRNVLARREENETFC